MPVSEDPEPFTDAVNSLSVPPISRVEDAFESDIGPEHLSYDLRLAMDTELDAGMNTQAATESPSPFPELFPETSLSMDTDMEIGGTEPLWTDLLNGFSPAADAGVDRGGVLGSPVSI